ncbi:MAG: 30S ribosomal protein S1 [Elusimicrobia bacterium]|nr:30S ribosomal protein S1 [Elusimicrobiota bacterium]
MTSEAPVVDDMSMEELLKESAPQSRSGSLVTATVVEVTSTGVLVDVGLKVEASIPLAEFRSLAKPPVVGDSFPVLIKRASGPEGPVVSLREARDRSGWAHVIQARDAGSTIEGTVLRSVKGGLMVDVGLEAFLPASQVDRRPVKDLEVWVGQKIQVVVIEMDAHKGNVVVSRRKLLENEAAHHRDATLKTLEVGKVLKGTVTSLTAFGAFVDLGGVEGLLRITDVSWGWVGKLTEVLKVGEVLEVKVLKFDPATGKIGLGRKQLLPKPWDSAEAQCPVGSIQKGKVTSLTDFGAFVEVAPGIEGLVHQSEFSWKERGVKPKEAVKLGDEVYVYVLSVNKAEEKMALSLKRAGENPWVEAARQYRQGTRVTGVVTNMLPVGAFVRLPSGIEGMIRLQDLSWTKTYTHPKEVFRVGQEVEAVVLEVNPTAEKMSLGFKQLAEDPYAAFSSGATVEAKVVRLTDSGAFLELAPDIEGYVHISEIASETRLDHPSQALTVGDMVTAQVVKNDRKKRRIDLSISKHERREEKRLLKQYKATNDGVSLGEVMGWGASQSEAMGVEAPPENIPAVEDRAVDTAPVEHPLVSNSSPAEPVAASTLRVEDTAGSEPRVTEPLVAEAPLAEPTAPAEDRPA